MKAPPRKIFAPASATTSGRCHQLLFRLDGTRSSHDDDFVATNFDPVDVDDRRLWMKFATGELVALGNPKDLLDGVAGLNRRLQALADWYADDADNCRAFADREVDVEALLLNSGDDVFPLFGRVPMFHDDDHLTFSLSL